MDSLTDRLNNRTKKNAVELTNCLGRGTKDIKVGKLSYIPQ
jgi:hypothetical protein